MDGARIWLSGNVSFWPQCNTDVKQLDICTGKEDALLLHTHLITRSLARECANGVHAEHGV